MKQTFKEFTHPIDEDVDLMKQVKTAFREVAKLTDVNDHTGARILSAKILQMPLLAKEYEKLHKSHMSLGYLSPKLSDARNVLDKKLEKSAKSKGPDVYKLYHNAL